MLHHEAPPHSSGKLQQSILAGPAAAAIMQDFNFVKPHNLVKASYLNLQ
jgi:hypothetical protein